MIPLRGMRPCGDSLGRDGGTANGRDSGIARSVDRHLFSKARSKYDREFAADGQGLERQGAALRQDRIALIASKAAQTDPFCAIEAVIPWSSSQHRRPSRELSRDEAFDPLALLTDYFTTLRKYAPAFLEAFQFRGAPVAHPCWMPSICFER